MVKLNTYTVTIKLMTTLFIYRKLALTNYSWGYCEETFMLLHVTHLDILFLFKKKIYSWSWSAKLP